MEVKRAGVMVAREHGETKGAVEKISGAGDENTRMELGPSEVGSGQKTLALFGWIK